MNIRRVVALARRHHLLLARAFATVVAFRTALTFMRYRRIARHIRIRHVPGRTRVPPFVVAWAVRQAARAVPFAHCLTQALATQYLLARQGDMAVIRVGMMADDGALDAHAWVVHDGHVLIGGNDRSLSSYATLVDLKPA